MRPVWEFNFNWQKYGNFPKLKFHMGFEDSTAKLWDGYGGVFLGIRLLIDKIWENQGCRPLPSVEQLQRATTMTTVVPTFEEDLNLTVVRFTSELAWTDADPEVFFPFFFNPL